MPAIVISSSNIGDVVSFSTHAPGILGTSWERVVILSILDADDATRFIDPRSMHQAVYPSLPAGTPNDPTRYQFLKVKTTNGSITAIGLPWVDPNTVIIHEETVVDFRVHGITAADVSRLREALIVAGATGVEVIPVP